MKTKELIKLLKEADPSGELHVRGSGGGAIVGCENKEGYWDGPYQYFDENKNLVISTSGRKIDLDEIDFGDVIWMDKGDTSRVLLDVYDSAADRWQREIEASSLKAKAFYKRSLQEFTFKVLKRVQAGWKIRHDGHEMEFYKGLRSERMCQGEWMSVRDSGFFEKITKGNEVHWRLIIA